MNSHDQHAHEPQPHLGRSNVAATKDKHAHAHLDARQVREELLNALTHGLGATAALAGGALLVTLAALHGDGWQLAGAIVFGTCLLLLYLAPTRVNLQLAQERAPDVRFLATREHAHAVAMD